MIRRLVREDVLGMSDYDWNTATQKEMHLTRAQIQDLEAGKIIRTASRGGTEFYLVEEPEISAPAAPRVICPTCGGKGHIEFTAEAKIKNRGKIA